MMRTNAFNDAYISDPVELREFLGMRDIKNVDVCCYGVQEDTDNEEPAGKRFFAEIERVSDGSCVCFVEGDEHAKVIDILASVKIEVPT